MDKKAMANTSVLGPIVSLRGLVPMTSERAHRGYALTRFLTSMRNPTTRTAFSANPEASMAAFGLCEEERGLVRRRDFDGMLFYGVSNVAIGKASAVLGTNLLERGAQGRGQTAADFIAERRARNEGQPWQF